MAYLIFSYRVVAEVMVLPGHRAEPAHLPERPLDRVVAAVEIRRQKFSGLLGEIQQHRAGLEDRDRLSAALRRMIDHRRNAVVGRDRQKLRRELFALADVDRKDLVGQPGLFEEHRDLVAVRRGPVIKVDHGAILPCARLLLSQERCDCMNLRGTPAQVNRRRRRARECDGVSARGELKMPSRSCA